MWSAPRAEVLDRYSGHTVLCPDSMAAYKTAQRAHSVLSIAAGLGAAAAVSYAAAASTAGSLQAGLLAKYVLPCGIQRMCKALPFISGDTLVDTPTSNVHGLCMPMPRELGLR